MLGELDVCCPGALTILLGKEGCSLSVRETRLGRLQCTYPSSQLRNYAREGRITRQEHATLPRLTDRITPKGHGADTVYSRCGDESETSIEEITTPILRPEIPGPRR